MEFSNETYFDLMHRMTGFNIDVIEEYFNSLSNKNLGKLTMKDVYNTDTILKLNNIEKRLKLQKLINKSK